MTKLAVSVMGKICKTVLFSRDQELRDMFNKKDAEIFRRISYRIDQVYKREENWKKSQQEKKSHDIQTKGFPAPGTDSKT